MERKVCKMSMHLEENKVARRSRRCYRQRNRKEIEEIEGAQWGQRLVAVGHVGSAAMSQPHARDRYVKALLTRSSRAMININDIVTRDSNMYYGYLSSPSQIWVLFSQAPIFWNGPRVLAGLGEIPPRLATDKTFRVMP